MGTREIAHFLAAVHFWYGCYYDWYYVKIPTEAHKMGESFGFSGKLKFLTYWNALLQGFFFTVCLINDLIGSNDPTPKNTPWIRKLRDKLLTSLAFPLCLFVSITFWGLYFVDRELIFPKVLDAYFPAWLNHLMHTNIVIFIVIEMITSYREYPTRQKGLTLLTLFMLCYLIWIHIIFHYTGVWVYPILEVLNLPLRIIFFLSLLGLISLLYFLGEAVNNSVWKKQLRVLKKR